MIKDLRDFISECEKENILKRIKTEVDWNLELSHISRLSEEEQGPSLLFENVKDYDIPVITGIFSTPKRLAIALGMDRSLSLCGMAQEWMKMSRAGHIPPEEVEKAPIKEKIIKEDEVDLLKQFPVPKFFPLDGGRYIGTAAFLVTEDPDEGWTNLGTYRMQVLDKDSIGIQFVKGKHARLMLDKYKKMGKKMPVAAVIGGPPVLFLVASTTVPYGVSEYNLAGALQKFPVEVVKSDLNNLLVPAGAEIVLEGEIDPDPDTFKPEGPLGEYTGYYSGKKEDEWPKPWFKVKRIMQRNNPIFTATTVGGPITDTHMLGTVQISASIWSDLMEMRIPGIKSVFCPPATTGRIWAIVSIKQMYPGHPVQVGCAVAGSTSGHYRLKGIIIVDDDIPADDWDKVFWALSVRYDPERSTQIIKRTRSGPLDPALPINQRDIGSKIIMDACIPFEWEKKPIKIELDEDIVAKVRKRWKEYGF